MKEIVVNDKVGGFSLSRAAFLRLKEMGNKEAIGERESGPPSEREHCLWNIPRDDKDLVAVVKELGKKANGSSALLKIVEIPDDVEWEIENYAHGHERVAEKRRTWSPREVS